jgi:phosphoribosyl-AMP cyclohydrolase
LPKFAVENEEENSMKILSELKYDRDGLVAAVIQDETNNEILMVGYMNTEAIRETLNTRRVCFWSRSRQKLWIKGETSGHTQTVESVAVDCDGDALLIKVTQKVAACHTGYRSCFFREVSPDGESTRVVGEKIFDADAVY